MTTTMALEEALAVKLTDGALKSLLELTGVKEKDEEEQVFLARLHAAVEGLPDTKWDEMPKPCQEWSNACTVLLDAKKDLPGRAKPKDAGKTDAGSAPKSKKEKTKMATTAKKPKTAAKKGAAKKSTARKKVGEGGRPRIAADSSVKRLVKEPPEGNRNEHWAKVPNGTTMDKIRKNKTLLRVVRYWRRNGFVELVGGKKAA